MIDLKAKRIEKSMTQFEVAKAVGITQQYYSLIESGLRGRMLPVPTAKRIAAVYGIDWQRFYEDENTPVRTEQA